MDKEKFIKLSIQCGYARKEQVHKYVETYPKEEYFESDFLELFRQSDRETEILKVKYRQTGIENGRSTKKYQQSSRFGSPS